MHMFWTNGRKKIDFSLSFLCATICLLIFRYEREKNVPARQIKYKINERSEEEERERERKRKRETEKSTS